ncbi:hypothetical protein [Deinococcus ruber]|uniref:Uncharacterized protein n=1 Tax=Deinococcus ruber TaxID=1848197 RepID=A0A918CGD6_9DEIO|nr:hypothetical protein [Deinococcus ruber]GGR22569.1 hypothetical protein GCM10008957_38250 [Deinococcus ruber]
MLENAPRTTFLAHVYLRLADSDPQIVNMMDDLVMLLAIQMNMKESAVFSGVPERYIYEDIEEVYKGIDILVFELLCFMSLPIEEFALSVIEVAMLKGAAMHVRSGFRQGNFFQNIANKFASYTKKHGMRIPENYGDVFLPRQNWNPIEGETRKAYLYRVNKIANKQYDSETLKIQGNIDARAADWLWEQFCGNGYMSISEKYQVSEETVKNAVQTLRTQLDIKRPKGRPKMVKKTS